MPKKSGHGGYGGHGGGHGGHGGGHGGGGKGCAIGGPSLVGDWADCEDESPKSASAPKHVGSGGNMYSEEYIKLVRENEQLKNRQAALESEVDELSDKVTYAIQPIETVIQLTSADLGTLSNDLQKASRDKFSADVDALKSEVENLKKWNEMLIVATGVACLMTVISFRVAYSACSRFNR
jgi:cell division protein FtsB